MTAGKIAQELAVSDDGALGLKPAAKKGACSYYERSALPDIKKAVN